jgi:hypothetical protein
MISHGPVSRPSSLCSQLQRTKMNTIPQCIIAIFLTSLSFTFIYRKCRSVTKYKHIIFVASEFSSKRCSYNAKKMLIKVTYTHTHTHKHTSPTEVHVLKTLIVFAIFANLLSFCLSNNLTSITNLNLNNLIILPLKYSHW